MLLTFFVRVKNLLHIRKKAIVLEIFLTAKA